jgi:Tol biopolymer transport system component
MIAGTETGTHPAFSPDGQWIVFHRNRDGTLVRVPVTGGSQITIVNNPAAFNPHWGTPDQIVYSGPPGIFIVPATGGTPKRLQGLSGRRPFLLPDGSGVLSQVGAADAAVYDLRTDSITVVIRNARNPVYTPTGHLIYGDEQGGISAVRFDLKQKRVMGEAVRVLDRAATNLSSRAISVSNNGTLVHHEGQRRGRVSTRVVMLGLDGDADTLPLPRDRWSYPRFSPTGRFLALSRGSDGVLDEGNIYTYDLVSRTTTQITFGGGYYGPVWSPDGTRLAFARLGVADGRAILVKAADNSGAETTLVAGIRASISPVDWPRDDLIMYRSVAGMYQDIMMLSLEAGSKPVRYHAGAEASVSPDGRHAVFSVLESTPRYQVLIREFPTPVGQWKVPTSDGRSPRWSPDGYVYYWKLGTNEGTAAALQPARGEVGLDTLFRAQVDRDPSVVVRAPEVVTVQRLGIGALWDLHPDGKRYIVALPESDRSESADDSPAASRHVIVLNWFTELNQLTSARR